MAPFNTVAAIRKLVAKGRIKLAAARPQHGLDRRRGALLGSALHGDAAMDHSIAVSPAALSAISLVAIAQGAKVRAPA